MAKRKDGTARRNERYYGKNLPIAGVDGRARKRGRRGVRARNRARRIVERMENGTYTKANENNQQPKSSRPSNSP